MTPTLNPAFAPWTCIEAGTGIACTGRQDLAHTNEAIGRQCEGPAVDVTGVQRSKLVRPAGGQVGDQRGSRPERATTRSRTGASSSTATAGPNMPGVPATSKPLTKARHAEAVSSSSR